MDVVGVSIGSTIVSTDLTTTSIAMRDGCERARTAAEIIPFSP